jgi:hypothetical protein
VPGWYPALRRRWPMIEIWLDETGYPTIDVYAKEKHAAVMRGCSIALLKKLVNP